MRKDIDYLHDDELKSQSTVKLLLENRFRKAYNNTSEEFNNYIEKRSDSGFNSEEKINENEIERKEEEKIMSIVNKEPKPPWKITLLTDQEEKRDNICC